MNSRLPGDNDQMSRPVRSLPRLPTGTLSPTAHSGSPVPSNNFITRKGEQTVFASSRTSTGLCQAEARCLNRLRISMKSPPITQIQGSSRPAGPPAALIVPFSLPRRAPVEMVPLKGPNLFSGWTVIILPGRRLYL
jgi:hypothetical protein